MPKCPNCGRETKRTEDWACQWCGQPLLSGAFKKIDKTYRQLQEERLIEARPKLEEEPRVQPSLAVEAELEMAPEPAPPQPEPEIELEAEPSSPPEPVPEIEAEIEEELAVPPEPEAETAEEAVAEAEELEPVPEPIPAPEVQARAMAKQAAVPLLEPEPEADMVTATVDELNSAFNADKRATNDKLTDKVLKVTGTVDKIFVKDHLDIYYIMLSGLAKPAKWQVRCTFGREHSPQLTRLTVGQTETVTGKYAGYERNIILKDCHLV